MIEDWQQKFMAIRALDRDACLRVRDNGSWFVSTRGVEISDGKMLTGIYSSGELPSMAVDDYWDRLANLKPGERVVIGAMSPKRREVRWNGFMWEDVSP